MKPDTLLFKSPVERERVLETDRERETSEARKSSGEIKSYTSNERVNETHTALHDRK